jgi:hypothetical protein
MVRLAVVTVVAGAVAEVLVLYLVTHIAIVTAPLGFEYSGETAAPILILGVAHLALVGALLGHGLCRRPAAPHDKAKWRVCPCPPPRCTPLACYCAP